MANLWAVIFGAVITPLGIWFLVVTFRNVQLGLRSNNWPTAPGRITDSDVKRDDGCVFEVVYRYEVDGISRRGDVLQVGKSNISRAEAEALQQSYPVGSEVAVHYDPAQPARSVLRPGVAPAIFWGAVSGTTFLVGRVLRLPADATSATVFFQASEGNSVNDVAVDRDGNVYVTDDKKNRVLKFAATGGDPVVLPFADLSRPQGVTVDTAGNIYVVDSGHHRVLKLAAGEQNPVELPFKELETPYDVAVDAQGNVYVTDRGYRRVMKFSPGQ